MTIEAPLHSSRISAGMNPPHYDRVQRAFHWGMAAIILVALLIGLYCSYQVPGNPTRRWLLEWHKSLGLTALGLIGFRIAYKLATRTPPYAERMDWLTHSAARGAHLALYALMVLMPLTGYLTSGAGGYSLPWFGLFQWPRMVPLDKGLSQRAEILHGYGAYLLYTVLTVHVLAVLWHRFVMHDNVLARMWPNRRSATPTKAGTEE